MARILVVGEEAALGEEIFQLLEEEGHEILTDSGEKAVELLGEKNFDVVLTGVMMPAIKGTEILNYVTRNLPGTLVLVITEYASVEEAVRMIKEGASDYISRPFKANEVQLSIKKALKEADFREGLRGKTSINGEILGAINAISNPTRREIMEYLSEGSHSFHEITKKLDIRNPPRLSFHLNKLRELKLVAQDQKRKYTLTPFGYKILKILGRLKALE
jgi:DNA-binding NtrC family response regulator